MSSYTVILLQTSLNRLQGFIRETAHEIRTPMNSVSIGFRVIKKELSESQRLRPGHLLSVAESSGAPARADQKPEEEKKLEMIPSDPTALQSIMQMVDDTKASADIAVDLVSDLLLYDRLEEGALQLEKTPLNVWAVIEDTLSLFKVQVGIRLGESLAVQRFHCQQSVAFRKAEGTS